MNEFWEQRYSEPGYVYGTEPNAFLVAQRHRLMPGMKALAVADGEGRNGVWLAQQGLNVLAVDASPTALKKARGLAAARGTEIRTECVDLTEWSWPRNAYDLIAAIFIHFPPEHRPRMHRAMLDSLKPGGLLIMEAFHTDQIKYASGGPPVPEMLYTAAMLEQDLAAAEGLELQEAVTELREGIYHNGTAAVVHGVWRRPVSRGKKTGRD